VWVELCSSVGEEEENEGEEMSVEKVWLSVRGGVRGWKNVWGWKGSGRDSWDRGLWDRIPPALPHTCIPYFGPHLPTPSEFLHPTHLFGHFDVCEELRDRIWG